MSQQGNLNELISLVEDIGIGRGDPVEFTKRLLGVNFHNGQKLAAWLFFWRYIDDSAKGRCLALLKEWEVSGELEKRFGFAITAEEVIQNSSTAMKFLLTPANQWGKSLWSVCMESWCCFYKIGVEGNTEIVQTAAYPVAYISPILAQVATAYNHLELIFTSKFQWLEQHDGVVTRHQNVCRIPGYFLGINRNEHRAKFANNSFIYGSSTGEDKGSGMAGSQFYVLVYDECGQSSHLKEELPGLVFSRTNTFGIATIMVSTPEETSKSKQYHHHITKLGMKGKDYWFTWLGSWDDNPYVPEEKKEEAKRKILSTNKHIYRQVFYGEFVKSGGSVFDSPVIERIWDETLIKWPEDPFQIPDLTSPKDRIRKFVILIDWGLALTGDPTVIFAWDVTDPDHVFMVYDYRVFGASTDLLYPIVFALRSKLNRAPVIHDTTSLGGKILSQQLSAIRPINFNFGGSQYQSRKADAVVSLVQMLTHNRKVKVLGDGKEFDEEPNFGKLRSYYIDYWEEELGNYIGKVDGVWGDKKLRQDSVMTAAIGAWTLMRNMDVGVGVFPLYGGQRIN